MGLVNLADLKKYLEENPPDFVKNARPDERPKLIEVFIIDGEVRAHWVSTVAKVHVEWKVSYKE